MFYMISLSCVTHICWHCKAYSDKLMLTISVIQNVYTSRYRLFCDKESKDVDHRWGLEAISFSRAFKQSSYVMMFHVIVRALMKSRRLDFYFHSKGCSCIGGCFVGYFLYHLFVNI